MPAPRRPHHLRNSVINTAANAVLAAAGYTFQRLLAWLAILCAVLCDAFSLLHRRQIWERTLNRQSTASAIYANKMSAKRYPAATLANARGSGKKPQGI
jgi:hypothetical protein